MSEVLNMAGFALAVAVLLVIGFAWPEERDSGPAGRVKE